MLIILYRLDALPVTQPCQSTEEKCMYKLIPGAPKKYLP